jgi:hypothetical protein
MQSEKEDLEKLLEESYRAAVKESMEITKNFEAIDLNDWNEY